jgi:hypothetical protein
MAGLLIRENRHPFLFFNSRTIADALPNQVIIIVSYATHIVFVFYLRTAIRCPSSFQCNVLFDNTFILYAPEKSATF